MILVSFSFLIIFDFAIQTPTPAARCQESNIVVIDDDEEEKQQHLFMFFFPTAGGHTFAARRVLGSPQL